VIEDQDWERSWMDNFQPMRFGQRLWIVPSWHAAPEKDAVNLLLDPGLAFGTGTHPTTALCLEWLDGQELEGARCWTSAAARASWPSPRCCWAPAKRWAPTSTCRPGSLARQRQRNGIADEKLALYLPEHMPAVQADVLVPTSSPARWCRWRRSCPAWSPRWPAGAVGHPRRAR
jgi:ribosomal protein L11 methyltransferase